GLEWRRPRSSISIIMSSTLRWRHANPKWDSRRPTQTAPALLLVCTLSGLCNEDASTEWRPPRWTRLPRRPSARSRSWKRSNRCWVSRKRQAVAATRTRNYMTPAYEVSNNTVRAYRGPIPRDRKCHRHPILITTKAPATGVQLVLY
ncbi:unnamed protein product, partial [Ectocarpus sp. 4 AP-2014]